MAKPKTKDLNVIYDVTFAGQYNQRTQHGTDLKPFELTVKMNHEMVTSPIGPMGVFRKHLATDALAKLDVNATGQMYNFYIVSTERSDGEPLDLIDLMSRQQLEHYIQENELDIETLLYPDKDELLQAVKDCEKNPDGFAVAQATRREHNGELIRVGNLAKSLNQAILPKSAELPTPPKPQAKSPEPPKPQAKGRFGKKAVDDDDI